MTLVAQIKAFTVNFSVNAREVGFPVIINVALSRYIGQGRKVEVFRKVEPFRERQRFLAVRVKICRKYEVLARGELTVYFYIGFNCLYVRVKICRFAVQEVSRRFYFSSERNGQVVECEIAI